jgi:hypothetical protein
MITYAEVKSSPSGWEDIKMSFESELTALVDSYRNTINKRQVSRALFFASDIVEKDEGWIFDDVNIKPETPVMEPPVITSLEPNTVIMGGRDLIMRVLGREFTEESVIVFNGGDEPTTFVSENEVSTGVKPSLVSAAIVVPVLIRNADGQESEPFDFTFTESTAGG